MTILATINYSEAGQCYEGKDLSLRELNDRLAHIVSQRMRESDQSPWYYKTSVTIIGPDIEYTARIDVCPRFCADVWIHRILECHLENNIRYSWRFRHKQEYIGLFARRGIRAAVKLLKAIRKERLG